MKPITVAVLDNDAMAAEALCIYTARLCPEARIAWSTRSVALTLHRCVHAVNPPDVLLLDMALDGQSGTQVAAVIRRSNAHTSIIGVTAWDKNEYRDAAAQAGMQALLAKDVLIRQLAPAIRAAAAGLPWSSETAVGSETQHFDTVVVAHERLTRAETISDSMITRLSQRERAILSRYADGHSTDAIASDLHISRNSVFTYVRRACMKLGVHTRDEALDVVSQHRLFGGHNGNITGKG